MPIAKWKKFTDNEIKDFVCASISFRELQKKMGYSESSGSATEILRKVLIEKGIDFSHFKGQAWNKKDGSPIALDTVKKQILKVREYKCEKCGISEWNGLPITIQFHHIDGNHNNNEETNIQLLCPNCHSQTDNFCNKNSNNTKRISDQEFIDVLSHSTSICAACRELGITPNQNNYKRAKKLLNSSEN